MVRKTELRRDTSGAGKNDRELPGAAPTCVAECPTTREKFDRLSSRVERRTCFSSLRTDY